MNQPDAPTVARTRPIDLRLSHQVRRARRPILIAILPNCAILGAFAAWGLASHQRLDHFTGDPVALLHGSASTGAVSMLGAILWAAATALAVFGMLFRLPDSDLTRRFLGWTAAFSAWLMLDDVFLLHERVFPKYMNIPEPAVFVAYVGSCVGWLGAFWRRILATDWLLMVTAFALLGASMGIDACIHWDSHVVTFIEDSLKYLGIAVWVAYTGSVARQAVGRAGT